MLMIQRHQHLTDLLKERTALSLEELAAALAVSPSTVRRDLDRLEQQGLVERTHGGAVYRGQPKPTVVVAQRMNEQVDQKTRIGQHAASLVQPQMTVILDGGSTVYYAAQRITARPIQVVTNALLIANLFADDEQVELLMIGGNLYPRSGVMVGPIARQALQSLHADLMLFSVIGLYENELFNQNLAMAEIEQMMLKQAASAVLLMDSTKFGRKGLARVCSVDELQLIVTDENISPRWRKTLGDRLMVV